MTSKVRLKNLEQFGFGPNVMRKIKICTKCSRISKKGSVFCLACGAILPRETLYDRYRSQHSCCEECGTVLTDDARYCPQCGHRVLPKSKKYPKGGHYYEK